MHVKVFFRTRKKLYGLRSGVLGRPARGPFRPVHHVRNFLPANRLQFLHYGMRDIVAGTTRFPEYPVVNL